MKWRFTAFMILIVAILVFILVAPTGEWIQSLSNRVAEMGAWGPILGGTIIFLVCVCMLPLFPCIVAGGVIFGFGQGLLVVLPAALLGALTSALLGRSVLRKTVLESMSDRPRWNAVVKRFRERGFFLVILARCVPALPFGMQNCALGAIGIGLPAVFWGTIVGISPGVISGLYIGSAIEDVRQMQSGMAQANHDGLQTAFLGLGVLAVLTLVWWVNRVLKSTVKDEPV